MQSLFDTDDAATDIRPIHILGDGKLPQWLTPEQRGWLEGTAFDPKAAGHALLPGSNGVQAVLAGAGGQEDSPLSAGGLSATLPEGAYGFASGIENPEHPALAWALGHYIFRRYKGDGPKKSRRLRMPEGVDVNQIVNMAAAVWLGRDLINTPANDMGPGELEETSRGLASFFGAECSVINGDELLEKNLPLIHAVGRASPRTPRLIELRWGDESTPKVTIVGKGICFDTGGLNLKPGNTMDLMKKDMGGSAAVLALAAMIMGAKLPVRLRVLIAAAENSVAGNALRPGDILKSRTGLHVEIGNTDAEGRLVLADALALADEDKPDHIFSLATLTGAARVALGADLPPVYSTNIALAQAIAATGTDIGDPSWPMPLWAPYDKMIDSKLGDIRNIGPSPFAGSIIAALFLNRFVKSAKHYTHFDIYGWVPKTLPGKPAGGEPQCARAIFEYLKGAYSDR
ncbi:MAG: leucyl aminopeptidase family protein [Hyphomicrobiales bacterium]|nr:leucyl aminopeptidase family protein [Hyphomicrobiales bacterium]